MKKTILLCLSLVLLYSSIIATSDIQENSLSKKDEIVISNLHDEYEKSLVALDWDALIEFYAEDAVQMPPNEPVVVGKVSIKSRLYSIKGISWEHRDRPIKILGGRDDLAFVWSSFKQKGEWDGSPFSGGGEMLQVYRKQSDGSWKIVCDIWSYDK